MEVWSCFSVIREQNFFKLVASIVNNMERIKCLNVTDPLIIPMIFIFLSCREKTHDDKVVKIQKLIVNPESRLVKSNAILG